MVGLFQLSLAEAARARAAEGKGEKISAEKHFRVLSLKYHPDKARDDKNKHRIAFSALNEGRCRFLEELGVD